VEKRLKGHTCALLWHKAKGSFHQNNRKLQGSFNAHGITQSECIAECSEDLLLRVEQHYIDTLKPALNMNPTAGGGWDIVNKNAALVEKMKLNSRDKKRQQFIAMNKSAKHIELHRASQKGKVFCEKHKAAISAGTKRGMTVEVRAKISAGKRGIAYAKTPEMAEKFKVRALKMWATRRLIAQCSLTQ
jgi:hypothetical protein